MSDPYVPDPDPHHIHAGIEPAVDADHLADAMDPALVDPFEADTALGERPFDIETADADADAVAGTPSEDAGFWQPQTTAFTCAVQAQRGVIEAMTGEDVSEAQLVYEATADGCLSDGGMSPYDVGQLLWKHDVANHPMQNATVADLVAELSLGHKVIVGVDAGELWETDFPLEDFFGQAADHAIWVTGVDQSDPAHPKVIVNDSGDPDGAGKAYDLDRFVDAWADSGFFYVATDHAPADYTEVCSAFDPTLGHIPALATYFGQHTDGFDRRLEDFGGAVDVAEAPMPADRDAFLRSI